MGEYRSRFGKALNVFRNENKFKYGCKVKIVKNKNRLRCYDNLIGTIGIYVGLDYKSKKTPFKVRLIDNYDQQLHTYGFSQEELKQID